PTYRTATGPPRSNRLLPAALLFGELERPRPGPADPELSGTWLYCGYSPHDFAVVKGPNGKLHHFGFFLNDWNEILRAGDIFAMDDVPVDVGPTRHGITRGGTIYFFDPSGNRNEVFCGGYRTGPDFPGTTWTASGPKAGRSSAWPPRPRTWSSRPTSTWRRA